MSFKDEMYSLIEKHFGGSSKTTEDEKPEEVAIAKSVDIEKKVFTAVVLRPNEVDLHGDIYSEEVVEKACYDYLEYSRGANLQHLVDTQLAAPVESYIAKSDFSLGEGQVKAGDWVLSMRINNDELWEKCKSGEFTGFSVGCTANVEDIND